MCEAITNIARISNSTSCRWITLSLGMLVALVSMLTCSIVVAQELMPSPNTTVAFPRIVTAEFNGDVRDLPEIHGSPMFDLWNEPEEPPYVKRNSIVPEVAKLRSRSMQSAAAGPMPAPMQSFDGLYFSQSFSNAGNPNATAGLGWPPDTNGDVGPIYYVQAVNATFAIYDKATGMLQAAFTENALWFSANTNTPCDGASLVDFGGPIGQPRGDPVVLHDGNADRWILTNFAYGKNSTGSQVVDPFYECIAVSKTNDPMGDWWLYAVQMDPGMGGAPPNAMFNDYPKFGLWNDCLYMTANEFDYSHNGDFAGSAFAAFSRVALFSHSLNSTNNSIGFIPASGSPSGPFSMLPANYSGKTLPIAGRPEYFVSQSHPMFAYEVRTFQKGANACGPGSSLSAPVLVSQDPFASPRIEDASFSDGFSPYIVPQKDTPITLDTLGDRLMQKAQYRKIGSTESLWVVHTTCGATPDAQGACVDSTTPTQLQWAQIDVTLGNVNTTPVQQQIYSPDSAYRWMGSLAVDHLGNMAMGYSKSSSSDFPSIAYAGRLASDPLGELPQAEGQLIGGGGSQTNKCPIGGPPCHRWGDYSSMSIDPSDDCTFWFTTEYYDSAAGGASGDWHTRIGSFKFPVCDPNQTITFTSAAPPSAVVGGPGYRPKASATSGLVVALTIDPSATAVCSITNGGVSFSKVGTCIIDANQAGNGYYKPAPQVQQKFAVGKGSQTISYTSTAPNPGMVGGATYAVTATGGPSGNPVTFTIDASSAAVCAISGNTVSFIGSGTCVINANQAGNANYNPASQAQQMFQVDKADQTITFTSTPPANAVVGGPTYNVTATGGGSGNPVTFTIDATAAQFCSISGSTVSFTAAGNCVIDANQAGNSDYNAAPQVQQSFTINDKIDQTITFTSIPPANPVVGGPTYNVTATGGGSGNPVTFTIDAAAASFCSISGSTVSFIATGNCVIDANQAGNATFNPAPQAQQTITVNGKTNQTISFTSIPPAKPVVGGPTYNVTATGGGSGNPVTFTIDATAASFCSISGSTVSFIATGNCVIDANQAGNETYNPAPQAQQSIMVSAVGSPILVFTMQPTSLLAREETTSAEVSIEDASGSVQTGDSATLVTLTASNCPSSIVGIATADKGVARFQSLRFHKVAIGVKLHATSAPALTPADSQTFDVLAYMFGDDFEQCTP